MNDKYNFAADDHVGPSEYWPETFAKPARKKKAAAAAGTARAPAKDKNVHLKVTQVKPLTEAQRQFIYSFKSGSHVIADGSAGTGKTFLATFLALDKVFNKEVDKIVYVRSIVATRDLGFLPGNIWEKSEPYWSLFKDHVNELCENGTAWDIMFKKGMIEFETTSFLRGKTWNNAVVVIDEVQNLSRHEIYTALTRVGKNSQVILCGDQKQSDLAKRDSGWVYLKALLERTSDLFDTVTFSNNDIVRSDFVKQIIIADSEMP